MKKLPSKIAHKWPIFFQPAQNRPKSHFLFNKNVSQRNFYIHHYNDFGLDLLTDMWNIHSCMNRHLISWTNYITWFYLCNIWKLTPVERTFKLPKSRKETTSLDFILLLIFWELYTNSQRRWEFGGVKDWSKLPTDCTKKLALPVMAALILYESSLPSNVL